MITLNSLAMLSLTILDLKKFSVIQLEIQFKSYLRTSKSIHEEPLPKQKSLSLIHNFLAIFIT